MGTNVNQAFPSLVGGSLQITPTFFTRGGYYSTIRETGFRTDSWKKKLRLEQIRKQNYLLTHFYRFNLKVLFITDLRFEWACHVYHQSHFLWVQHSSFFWCDKVKGIRMSLFRVHTSLNFVFNLKIDNLVCLGMLTEFLLTLWPWESNKKEYGFVL